MNANQIIESLKNRKGQHVRVSWRRQLKTRKGVEIVIEKETTAFVRAGIDYANLASVRNGIAAGERGAVEPLPWGEWVQFPFVIGHKGAEYVRLYPAVFDNLKKPAVTYYVGGSPTTDIESLKELCLASEFRDRDDEPAACFTLRAESITDIAE